MKTVVFSPLAERDLAEIWDCSAEYWSIQQADRYLDDIRDACRALAMGIRQGRSVDVRPDYLKYLAGEHMIYFRDQGTCLEIIRILHGRMDVNRHL